MATKKPSAKTIAKLGRERREVMAQIDELTKRKAEIDAKLLTADMSTAYEGEGVVVSFTPRRTLDSAFIAKKFPASKRPELYKLTLDTQEFKKSVSPNDLETYQKISYIIKVDEA